jgi:hypothetical protein
MQQTTQPRLHLGWAWPAGAFVLVLAATLLPKIRVGVAAPLAALLIGAGAAWWARSTAPSSLGRSAAAGAVTGIGALLASMVAFTILGFAFGSSPEIQEFVRTSEPDPEARIPYPWIAPLGAVFGVLVGLGFGLLNLVLATIGGVLVGLRGEPTPAPRPA